MEKHAHHGVEVESLIDHEILNVINIGLFHDNPPFLNSFFRFQLGSNTFDGYEFARDAWKRVSMMGSQGKTNDQSLESLRQQKESVKRELKLFDVQFTKFYGRQPSRLDKECLRKLYEFHKQLKAYIAAEEVKMERKRSMQTLDVRSSSKGDDSLSANTNNGNKLLALDQLQEIDVKVLKAEKRALKIKLRRFEDEFIRQHGQKPQSYQEVGSIREDYSRYKFLKEQLQAVEQHQSQRDRGNRDGKLLDSP
mmetsp:Transcript_42383/g.133528  ORF Transcript_42383/g.133528 Transcript_42383/m.133528 type:complete len:251 (-) Transcript_42383:1054-1806(-)